MTSFARIRTLMRKELRQVARDRRTLAILLVIPSALILLVGYAINLDVKHVRCAIVDADATVETVTV